MSVPYTHLLQIVSGGGEQICFALPAPPRGALTRLIVKQTEGTLGGFSFDVYDREQACLSSSYSISEEDAEDEGGVALGLEPELHKIMATVTVAATVELSEQFDLVRPYINQDDRDQRETPATAIYMRLDPAGGGDKMWQIAYTITSDMG